MTEWAQELYLQNKDRADISIKEAEEVITAHIVNDEESNSMENSILVKRGFINHHLPFLPLERKHVRKCILDEIKVKKLFCSLFVSFLR